MTSQVRIESWIDHAVVELDKILEPKFKLMGVSKYAGSGFRYAVERIMRDAKRGLRITLSHQNGEHMEFDFIIESDEKITLHIGEGTQVLLTTKFMWLETIIAYVDNPLLQIIDETINEEAQT